ncbi:HK97 gp10 family phage protein [Sodalis praecaptivus]|uniref:HK97 gp10 family phage protein n=1 Tax=Sodalis TaxID=84565 RepID=UPI00046D79EA|nr:HK97 gp10 family phage protein [Sodalis praecaptivus]
MGFSASIGKWSGETIKRSEYVGKEAAIALFRGIILDTPVDTGRLRANWQVSADSPVFGQLALDDKDGAQTVEKMTTVVLAQGRNFTVYMTNNLPYAQVAEYGEWKDKNGNPANGPHTVAGYSTQAPAGMVRRNMSRINTNLNKAMILVK